MEKRVAFHTLGCKLNQAETSAIRARMLEQGFTEVAYGAEADLLVINTCTVTDTADAECRQIIRRGLKGAPSAAVAVTGCYAQLKPEEIASIEGVHAVFGSTHKMDLVQHAHEIMTWDSPRIFVTDVTTTAPTFVGARTSLSGERSRAYLKLQDGCDYSCTFCTIPKARGGARAMPFDDVHAELQALASQGYHEVVLTGINLGEYQAPSQKAMGEMKRFIDVLRLIDFMAPPFRVRVSSIEPNTLSSEMILLMAQSTTLVPHVHVPLQSGSAEVLRMMRRRYNPEMYKHTLMEVRQHMPTAGIGIDVIVGFPGETDALFEESLVFIESLPFTYLHVFTYSEREGTPAATFTSRVPLHVRKQRTAKLRALSVSRQQAFAASQLESTRTVISDKYDAATQMLSGITENNIVVAFPGNASRHRTPQTVLLTALHNAGVYGIPVP